MVSPFIFNNLSVSCRLYPKRFYSCAFSLVRLDAFSRLHPSYANPPALVGGRSVQFMTTGAAEDVTR